MKSLRVMSGFDVSKVVGIVIVDDEVEKRFRKGNPVEFFPVFITSRGQMLLAGVSIVEEEKRD
jgi:hypothetical protein